eukprot:1566017-Alexandrium_andersonii.AAC.1
MPTASPLLGAMLSARQGHQRECLPRSSGDVAPREPPPPLLGERGLLDLVAGNWREPCRRLGPG